MNIAEIEFMYSKSFGVDINETNDAMQLLICATFGPFSMKSVIQLILEDISRYYPITALIFVLH